MEEFSRPATLDDLLALPDQAARDFDPAWLEEGENIRIADAYVVDVMVNAGGETYESLLPFAETLEFAGQTLRTVNLEGLLRTKRGTREKDVVDRLVLERALDALGKRRHE